jgi:predicted urease superfamily metal-dependent hydrolase
VLDRQDAPAELETISVPAAVVAAVGPFPATTAALVAVKGEPGSAQLETMAALHLAVVVVLGLLG